MFNICCIWRMCLQYCVKLVYSATGGADSGPASAANTPTEEQAGQLGAGKYGSNIYILHWCK